ncbi:MAG: DNA alkylation repair protein [Pseudomonadales bacterium]|nr:DNA alkylation repair protein [Pseudomonadales bacterium]
MNLKNYLDEVESHTQTVSLGVSEEITPMGFRRLYIRVPQLRKITKTGYSFYALPAQEIVNIWDYIWRNTQWYEVAHQALYYYQHKTLLKFEFAQIKHWIRRCDCWEHSDDLSKIYAQVVEDNATWILPYYDKWNRSDNPWQRRQSIVGLIEYASKRRRVLPYEELIQFVQTLLDDEDYYVQKGVGWTLREIYNVYPSEALGFIERNIKQLSPNAFSSATEKLDKNTKTRLKLLRKR